METQPLSAQVLKKIEDVLMNQRNDGNVMGGRGPVQIARRSCPNRGEDRGEVAAEQMFVLPPMLEHCEEALADSASASSKRMRPWTSHDAFVLSE